MKIKDKIARLHYVQSALVSLAVGMFFAVIVPFQTFMGNRDMFDFTGQEVFSEAMPVAIGLVLFSFVLLLLSELVLGRLLHVIMVVILVCGYFETGIFSIGIPPLDGAIEAFSNPFRLYIDSLLLFIVSFTLLVLYKWVRNFTHWIALAILLLGLASLFDVRSPESTLSKSNLSSGFCPQLDVVESLRFSPKRNVIVLILDSTPAVMASELVKKNPELQNHFPGFIAYENNIAMHEKTVRGLPGLMTGEFLSPDISTADYVSSMFGEKSLLMPYVAADDPVYFSGGMLSHGYTNRRLGDFSKVSDTLKKTGAVFFRNSNGIPYVSLWDVVVFRILPYAYKSSVLAKAYGKAMKNNSKRNWYDEGNLYQMISSRPLGNEQKTTLSVLHTEGIHGPICKDRYGKTLAKPARGLAAYYEYGIYKMGRVGAFLDKLRKLGVYENALIVIAADHGLIDLRKGGLDADGSTGHGSESSILWVKPIGASKHLEFSQLPTSNCRIAELVKQAADKDLDRTEIDKILYTKERHFYAKHGVTWWSFGRRLFFYEWVYDETGKLKSYENKGIYKAN